MEEKWIYITIGPQCSGKTSYLLNKVNNNIDINMDNINITYNKILIQEILQRIIKNDISYSYNNNDHDISDNNDNNSDNNNDNDNNNDYNNSDNLENNNHEIDKKINQLEENETIGLILYFTENISFDDLYLKLRFQSLLKDQEVHIEYILDVVSELYSRGYRMETLTYDLYLIENRSESITLAQQQLSENSKTNALNVAWGNTNLSPNFYRYALDIAYRDNRKVKFIKWGFELEQVTLRELYTRNIKRFLQTGRFIPFLTLLRFYENANNNLEHWKHSIVNKYHHEFNSINCDRFLAFELGYQLIEDCSIQPY